ncbi:hypothetical protein RRG08_016924 [Elysia crispata]|uniref:Uncharacterized protein n=1 Tax=Elysia crispata TaxID=231223 RepID=A0AAE1DKX5_9GAST|nr:hypothetical protein RRG08_016924 [Elysia crispata]
MLKNIDQPRPTQHVEMGLQTCFLKPRPSLYVRDEATDVQSVVTPITILVRWDPRCAISSHAHHSMSEIWPQTCSLKPRPSQHV